MKLQRYQRFFQQGEWHVHSMFSDGKNSPEEVVLAAKRLGLPLIAILDHVRRETSWVDLFGDKIRLLRERYKGEIVVLGGIEAKVVDLQGSLDVQPAFFENVDFVAAAFHRFPTNEGFMAKERIAYRKDEVLEHWFQSMLALLENKDVDVVVHPTNLCKIYDIEVPARMKEEIAKKAKQFNKIFEVNFKYNVPDDEFRFFLDKYGVAQTRGSDAHSVQEMIKYHKH